MSSRRKQSRPKHLDSDLKIPLENGSQRMPTDNDETTYCERCRRQFVMIDEYVAHRPACLICDDIYGGDAGKECVGNDLVSNRDDAMDSAGEDVSEDCGTDRSDEDEARPPTHINKSTDDESDDKFEHLMPTSKLDEDGDDEDEDDDEDMQDTMPRADDVMSFSSADGNNVKLEPLANTRAAVAQYSDVTGQGSDFSALHATLYNLQQQQIVQLQLIQHLQQQLLRGGQAANITGKLQSLLPALNAVSLQSLAPQLYPLSLSLNNAATADSAHLSAPRNESTCSNDKSPSIAHNTPRDAPKMSPASEPPIIGDEHLKCDICDTYFPNLVTLKIHYARHTAPASSSDVSHHDRSASDDKRAPYNDKMTSQSRSSIASACMTSSNPLLTKSITDFHERLARAEATQDHNPCGLDLAKSRSSYLDPGLSSLPSIPVTSPLTSMAKLVASDKSSVNPLLTTMTPSMNGVAQPPMSFLSPSSLPGPYPQTPDASYHGDSLLSQGKTIEPTENLEKYMECTKSETSKLEQLVKSIEKKMNDPNQCIICHRVLSCKSALQMHYRIHTGERPYRCKICGRSFTTKGNLKTHMGVHRSKPPLRVMHQCPVCHKQFTNLLVLQQHIRMHTNAGNEQAPNYNFHHQPWLSRPYPDANFMLPQTSELDLSRKTDNLLKAPGGELDLSLSGSDSAAIKPNSSEMGMEYDSDGQEGADIDTASLSEIDGQGESMYDGANGMKRPSSAVSSSSLSQRSTSPISNEPNVDCQDPNLYSTSLAALEARVNAIDTTPSFTERGYEQHKYDNESYKIHDKSGRGSPSSSDGGSAEYSSLNTDVKPSLLFPTSLPDMKSANFPGFPMYGAGMTPIPLPGADEAITTICNICYKTFACRSALDIHYRSHTKERPFKCEVCDRYFTTRGNMKQHMLTHKIRDLPDVAFESEEPARENDDNNNTNEQSHGDTKEIQDSGQGDDIPQIKIEPYSETNPAIDVPETKPIVTTTPPTSSADDQSPFIRRTGPKHQCQVCQKHFSSASALQIHIRTHTGDKPFKCNVCSKAFTTKGNLKVHMGTHMWNNSPSRRGRRMSIEPMFSYGQKENPYLAAAAAAAAAAYTPRPDYFFQYPPTPFVNGLRPKMNEVSVIQSLNGSFNRFAPHISNVLTPLPPTFTSGLAPPQNLLTPRSDQQSASASSDSDDAKPKYTSSGELDLSMKTTHQKDQEKSHKDRNVVTPKEEFPRSLAKSPSQPLNTQLPLPHHQSPYLAAAPWYWKGPYSSVLNGGLSFNNTQSKAYRPTQELCESDQSKDADENENKPSFAGGYTAELNLSLKVPSPIESPTSRKRHNTSPLGSPARKRHETSPSPAKSPRQDRTPSQSANILPTPWLWKSTCHMCSYICGSPSALDLHMRTQHFREDASHGLVA